MYEYNPYLNPYLNMYQQQNQHPIQQQMSKQEVVKVNGENGARAYPLGANSSALLLDESGTMVWLAVSDGAGYRRTEPSDFPCSRPRSRDVGGEAGMPCRQVLQQVGRPVEGKGFGACQTVDDEIRSCQHGTF